MALVQLAASTTDFQSDENDSVMLFAEMLIAESSQFKNWGDIENCWNP